jgi:hypothetical protein
LLLRDDAASGQALVSWVYPGPLAGTGFRSPHLNRGDTVRAVNGKPTSATAFKDLVLAAKPGDELELEVGRSGGPPDVAVPRPGATQRVEKVRLVLARRSDWTGPLADPPIVRDGPGVAALAALTNATCAVEARILKAVDDAGLGEPIRKLMALFGETRREAGGANSLSRVAYAFEHPARLPSLTQHVIAELPEIGRRPAAFLTAAAHNLDAVPPALPDPIALDRPQAALAAAAAALRDAQRRMEAALAAVPPAVRRDIPEWLGRYQSTLDPFEQEAPRLCRCLRASLRMDFDGMLQAAAALSALEGLPGPAPTNLPPVPLPRALRGAVKGAVLAVLHDRGNWLVYGGPGTNVYDMSRLAVVIDAGGPDTYLWPRTDRPAVQAITDLGGDDVYQSAGDGGPASACLGLSLLVDRAGDDHYSGGLRACASALAGVAMLVDLGGNDEYRGGMWSAGAAFYGAGGLIDLGGGSDVYWTDAASQGIGGPRGFGLLYDQGGHDLYRANGPSPSAYETPAVYYGLSQGVGFGVRGYDTGGVGILEDGGGNDRYEAGEFSQGGAYFWGLGILDDRGGNDLYYGNRYAQGFGCHQGAGVLMDHGGNDTYWAMCAADQGSAWDIASGLLLDLGGNDSYVADGLAQGSAAMQGIAWLVDLQGADQYRGSGQGQSSANSYHYDRTGCLSWSVLLDAGGGNDLYGTGRTNNQTVATGQRNDARPEESTLHGLFSDTDETLDAAFRPSAK